MGSVRYPLVRGGIFRTIQGEGALLGVPMVFVRLAGCSVGCEQCDTDYSKHEMLTADEIGERVEMTPCWWTWITGGEPTDYDLGPLIRRLRKCSKVAVATAGANSWESVWPTFISVSPHGMPADLKVRGVSQINLVPGLNGLRLEDWAAFNFSGFRHKYVTPMFGDSDSLQECLRWLNEHEGWRLGVQAHKQWGLP